MAQVTLIGPLRTLTGVAGAFDIEARNVRGLLQALGERFPELAEQLEVGVAVAIDGQIYQDDLLAPIKPDSEIQILPQIAGG